MINSISAKLVSWRNIKIVFLTEQPLIKPLSLAFYQNKQLLEQVDIIPLKVDASTFSYELKLKEDFDLGSDYHLIIDSFPMLCIDTSQATDFPKFDEKYSYDGDDLGSSYGPTQTIFKVWAPLASKVILKLVSPEERVTYTDMKRGKRGVYCLTITENLLNYKYHYLVTNNGVEKAANDLYAKGVSLNSEYSVVIDYEQLLKLPKIKPKTVIENYVDAIIYEVHIRDINEDDFNDVINKGKYLGFVETGRKTRGGNPAGLDYIKYLGMTHVQIQPILDFDSPDDLNTSNWYNWGYDPLSFFALEGSYSNEPQVAMTRLFEFREMVDQLHKNDLRLIVDVTYNHIYMAEDSDFEKIVPAYYFRKNKNGQLTNDSGCGNDFASERKMVRHIIVESVKYLFSYFDIDGLRIDLMGLTDIKTIKTIYKVAKQIKSDAIIYGEGWLLGTKEKQKKLANKTNAKLLPGVAFFNDTYRDIIKGPSMSGNLFEKGYICGNVNYVYGVDYAFHASVLPLSYNPQFVSANQSVNYLECHDNATLFDKLLVSNAHEDEVILLERVALANTLLLLSFGIPFLHMGQEIGLSKGGLDNTYKKLKINNLDYRLVDERFEMVNRFRLFNILRKKLTYTKLFAYEDMVNFFSIAHWNNGIYGLTAVDKNVIVDEKEFVILINPTDRQIAFELKDYYATVEGVLNQQATNIKNGFLPRNSVLLLFLKK